MQCWDYVRNPFLLSACKVEIMSGVLSTNQHPQLWLWQESFPPISMQSLDYVSNLSSHQLESCDYVRNPLLLSASKVEIMSITLSSYQLQSWDYVRNPFLLSASKVEIMSVIFPFYQLQSWDYVSNPFILSAAKLRLCQGSLLLAGKIWDYVRNPLLLSAWKVEIMSGILSSYQLQVENMSGILSSYQHAKLRLCQESFPSVSMPSLEYVRNPFLLSACKAWIMSWILPTYQHARLRLCQEFFPSISCKVEIVSGILPSYQHEKLRLCQESFPPISMQSWNYVMNPFLLSACKAEIMSVILSSYQQKFKELVHLINFCIKLVGLWTFNAR